MRAERSKHRGLPTYPHMRSTDADQIAHSSLCCRLVARGLIRRGRLSPSSLDGTCDNRRVAIIETMTFRLRTDANTEQFVAADAAVQSEFSYQQRGIVRRTIARSDDDCWLILTIWDSLDAAAAAAQAFGGADMSIEFVAMIDESTVAIERYAPAGAA